MFKIFNLIISVSLFFGITLNATNKLDKVSLQLQWKHQFQFAGFYIAKEKGFYKDIGLDVEIKKFNDKSNIVNDICTGKTTFATSYPSVILEKFNGKDIVLLSAILQLSPHVLISLKSSGIKSIQDFKNKRIMIESSAILTATIKSMLKSHNISFDDMKRLKHTFNIDDLIEGRTDIVTAFTSNELYELKRRGIKYDIWNPKDYGFDFYDVILFTSNEEMKNNSKRVKNFRKASLKGWEYAFNNIDETVDLILEKYNTQNKTKEALHYEAKILKKLTYKETTKLGNIDTNKVQRIYDMYNLMGLVQNKIEFKDFIYDSRVMNNSFTKKEIKYLKDKKQITMCIDPDWMPFESFDKNGKHIGMTADYFNIFKNIIKTKIVPLQTKTWYETLQFAKNRKCDIISLAMQTPKRKNYLNFTTPYLKMPLVIATKTDISFINDIESISGKKVGIPEGYAFVEILKRKYPNLNIIEVENITVGLKKVNTGELFGYIGTLASISYKFQTGYSGELKIAGKFDEKWELGVGVRNDDNILFDILEKAVNSVDKKQQQKILNDWVSIKYEKGVDYTLVWRILIVGFIIILFFIYRQNLLKKTNTQLKLLAATDSMTKLYNRRYFTEMYESTIDFDKRNKFDTAIIILDIDKFKNINDTYGHGIGDDVIVLISSILKKYTRSSDIVSRWGGEEFAILLPNTDIDGAFTISEKIRKVVEDTVIDLDDNKILEFTASFGVSQVRYETDINIDTVINRADTALYEAKQSGRNKVCSN
ncbi:MAG: diguanylate cyclase [Epsilonproteobacteria bacterium]|nr:MAG: diguanylate cyclase [Campylobacterota bacterium]